MDLEDQTISEIETNIQMKNKAEELQKKSDPKIWSNPNQKKKK